MRHTLWCRSRHEFKLTRCCQPVTAPEVAVDTLSFWPERANLQTLRPQGVAIESAIVSFLRLQKLSLGAAGVGACLANADLRLFGLHLHLIFILDFGMHPMASYCPLECSQDKDTSENRKRYHLHGMSGALHFLLQFFEPLVVKAGSFDFDKVF